MNFLTSDGKALVDRSVVEFHNPRNAVITGFLSVTDSDDVWRLWVEVYKAVYPKATEEDWMGGWARLWDKIPLCDICEERIDNEDDEAICDSCWSEMQN